MARQFIQVMPPEAGLDRAYSYQTQPPYTLPDANNVRCRDVFEQRARLGSRPGLVKAFAQQLGDEAQSESFTEDYFPTKDSFLDADIPNTNFGTNAASQFGRFGSRNRWRAVMHFDLSSIPANATIDAGTLTLRIGSQNTIGGLVVLVCRLTETGWVESEVTWNRAATATDWTDGGAFTESTPTAISFAWSGSTNSFYSFDVTTLVSDAYTNRSEQLHVLMKLQDDTVPAGNEWVTFASVDTSTSANRPKLTVTYEVAA